MFLGSFELTGEPAELLPAYDRLMSGLPPDGLAFHVCVAHERGITIYDCCPTREIFEQVSTSDDLLAAMATAGLPAPVVTLIGDVHVARSRELFITG